MIMKIPRLFYSFLCLFLLLLLFHEFYNSKYLQTIPNSPSTVSHKPFINHRKALASNFDFTPFLTRHHHRRKLPPPPPPPEDIDPRYGVEKRLVPSGPNPLHH
ncbi:hypothetical protein CDL12_29618 [Handroanthus impetiginosus]|uniref:CLAVATA3/ESR (CLE)-related protein 13 n=1 Tax=Handroanthus impetiginosus TaxID=429701 RepID=A0A2G9FZ23_9LAMI|nr:hypothetical protein CDL12_29618 [Handroanthus impetiginosus]